MQSMQGEKFQRSVRFQKRHKRKFKATRNHHHFLLPRSRGGGMSLNNLLLIDIEKHEKWHALWGNRTADEILDLLTRVVRAKKNQHH